MVIIRSLVNYTSVKGPLHLGHYRMMNITMFSKLAHGTSPKSVCWTLKLLFCCYFFTVLSSSLFFYLSHLIVVVIELLLIVGRSMREAGRSQLLLGIRRNVQLCTAITTDILVNGPTSPTLRFLTM